MTLEPKPCPQCRSTGCGPYRCRFTGLQHDKRELIDQLTPRDLFVEIADASQAFEMSDVSPHARVLDMAEPEHLYDDGTDYWTEKAKERREEFKEQEDIDRQRVWGIDG